MKKAERPWSFWLWIASVVCLAFGTTIVVSAWAVWHAVNKGGHLSKSQAEMVLSVAKFPELVQETVKEITKAVDPNPVALLRDRREVEKAHWVRRFPAPEDSGYLLFSGVDPGAKKAIVQLFRIADGKELLRWNPDWRAIDRQVTRKKYGNRQSILYFMAYHPLLLADGDIVFNTRDALVRLGPCSGTPVWVIDEVMHHSTEFDSDGGIWVPALSQEGYADNPWVRARVRDDALARVSVDGKVLERISVARILRDNGLQALLMGTSGDRIQFDPIHLNEIVEARSSTAHWQRGDLLFSARNLSTIFLYRPATGRIIWYQTGPWMNQHSVAFVGDHEMSVFDNNIIGGAGENPPFLAPGDINRVLVYNFDTGQVTEPFASLLARARPVTKTGGRAQLLPDGGLFIEETSFGRHLRFTKDSLLWSRVNDYDDKRIGWVTWSRYLTADEVKVPLQAVAARKCAERH